MKKKYVEPVMVVEDFTVSEMIAKNCGVIENELTFTQQASGVEHNFMCKGDLGSVEKNYAYGIFSDLFGTDTDPDDYNKDGQPYNDVYFTESIKANAQRVGKVTYVDVCNRITNETFNSTSGFDCSQDSSLIQNS